MVRLSQVVYLDFAGSTSPSVEPECADLFREMFVDVSRAYQKPFSDAWPYSDWPLSLTTMAESLIAAMEFPHRLDLVVLAYRGPDRNPSSTTASRLVELLPGRPMVVAISEQGIATPYTAMRIAHGQIQAGLAEFALVIGLDQSTPLGSSCPAGRDCGIGLLIDSCGERRLCAPRIEPSVQPSHLDGLVRSWTSPYALNIAGSSLKAMTWPKLIDREVEQDLAGASSLALWARLAQHWRSSTSLQQREIRLIDYDRELGYLCMLQILFSEYPTCESGLAV